MPRKPRVQQPGMIHHVIARGNNKENIFRSDDDKTRYLQLIDKYRERDHFKLLSYCLMDNHIHLLIKQGEVALSRTMQGIQQSYTQYYNKKYESIGHVFHQRFKSKPVDDEAYLLSLIAYIHKNPKVGRLVNDLNDYKWSSHQEILKSSKKNLADVDHLFELIGRDKFNIVPEYLWLLGEVNDDAIKEEYLKGDKLEKKRSEIYINERKEIKESKKYKIDEVLKEFDEYLLANDLTLSAANQRRVIVLLCDELCNAKNKEIADRIGVLSTRISSIRSEFILNKIGDEILDICKEVKTEIMNKNKNIRKNKQ